MALFPWNIAAKLLPEAGDAKKYNGRLSEPPWISAKASTSFQLALSLTSFCFPAGYVLGEAQEFLEWVLLPQKHFASKDYKTCG